jgi:hypothetical protein
MAFMVGLKECGPLEGAPNSTLLKCRLQMLMEEMELWSIVKGITKVPAKPQKLIQYEKKVAKVKIIIWIL